MTRPLSNDLRARILAAAEDGDTRRAIARRFGVASSTVTKLVQHQKRTGDIVPFAQGGDHRSKRIETHAVELKALIAETPDITLEELADHLLGRHGEVFVVSTIWRCLDRHGLTFKKNSARARAGARRRRGETRTLVRSPT
jgi:transposase